MFHRTRNGLLLIALFDDCIDRFGDFTSVAEAKSRWNRLTIHTIYTAITIDKRTECTHKNTSFRGHDTTKERKGKEVLTEMAEYWIGEYRYNKESGNSELVPVRKMTDEEDREMRKKRAAAGLAEPEAGALIFLQE